MVGVPFHFGKVFPVAKSKAMITIVNFEPRINSKTKESFFVLVVTAPMLRQSMQTGKFYVDAKEVTIPTPIQEPTVLQSLLGQQLNGEIRQVPCEPYEWKNPSTGKTEERAVTWQVVGAGFTPAQEGDA